MRCGECNSKNVKGHAVITMIGEAFKKTERNMPLCEKHIALHTLHYVGKTNEVGQKFEKVVVY